MCMCLRGARNARHDVLLQGTHVTSSPQMFIDILRSPEANINILLPEDLTAGDKCLFAQT